MPSIQIIIQNKFHQILRKEAIEHLAKSKQISARSFRQEYLVTGFGTYQNFLNDQKKSGVWGTYLEAIALSEKYGVNLVVTPVTRGVKQNPICLYRAESPDAKTVHLYNSNNTHWYVDSQTMGDGNCLYNAYAQELFRLGIITPQEAGLTEKLSPTKSTEVSITGLSIFHHKYDDETRTRQEAILSAISKAPTPAEKEQDFNRERERISKLPPQEQKQIAADHAYALRLAREEGIEIADSAVNSSLNIKP
jgi:hypothetical protein